MPYALRWLRRQCYRRLLVPLLRGHHPPEYTARGAMVGLAVAFTPLVGVQMTIVVLIWLAVRRLYPRWDFNVLVAAAWTWATNVFTAAPVYYLFFVTGRLMVGRWERLRGFDSFEAKLAQALPPDTGFIDRIWVHLGNLLEKFGLPMFVGCIPWALLMGWLGYRTSLVLVRTVRAKRARRRARRSQSTPALGSPPDSARVADR